MCTNAFSPGRNLNQTEDHILVISNILIACINIFTNGCVLYLIVKTKQFKNRSLKLTFLLSISEILTAVISQPLQIYFLYFSRDVNAPCALDMTLQSLFFFFPYFSVFTIAFIVYDRFVRITHLNKYEQYMTRWRSIFGVFLVTFAAATQVSLITASTLTKNHKISSLGVLPLNIFTLIFEVTIYIKTIYRLQKYKKESQKRLRRSDTSLVKLAAMYLLMIIIFFTPFMAINTVYAFWTDIKSFPIIQYTWLLSQVIYCINSFANSIMFLKVNRKAKVEMKLIIRRFLKTKLGIAKSMDIDRKCDSWRFSTSSTTSNHSISVASTTI